MNFLIGILVCILGFLLGKKSANDEILKYYQLCSVNYTMKSEFKVTLVTAN